MNKELIVHRYKHPKYFDENISTNGKSINASCGDEVYVQVEKKENKVVGIKYKGSGCSICFGSTELVIDRILQKNVEEILKMNEDLPLEIIGMEKDSPRRRCGTLGFEAIKNSLIVVE